LLFSQLNPSFDVEASRFGSSHVAPCTPSLCKFVNDDILWFDDGFDIYLQLFEFVDFAHFTKVDVDPNIFTNLYSSNSPFLVVEDFDVSKLPFDHHKLAPSTYLCFYIILTLCSRLNVDTIIDMML
jgi:hypothetical protein